MYVCMYKVAFTYISRSAPLYYCNSAPVCSPNELRFVEDFKNSSNYLDLKTFPNVLSRLLWK